MSIDIFTNTKVTTMTDPLSRLATLSRPSLLVQAAKIGVPELNRDVSLRRMLPGQSPPPPGQAFEPLLFREEAMEMARRDGGAAYSAAKHVELLSALIVEARLASHRLVA